jgi:hypothetical protein
MSAMPPIPERQFEKIAVLENLIEAQVIASILQEEIIPHRIRSFHDTAYDGLFQFQLGWGAVYAPAIYRPAILDILERIRSGEAMPGETAAD